MKTEVTLFVISAFVFSSFCAIDAVREKSILAGIGIVVSLTAATIAILAYWKTSRKNATSK
jgi:hypothetical protein